MNRASCLLVALILLLCSHAAPAFVICVSSSAQLEEAAVLAYSQPMTILMVQGTYQVPGLWITGNYTQQGGTQYLGGYLPNTGCTSRQIARGNTIIRSTSGQEVVIWPTGTMAFEGVTFQIDTSLYVLVDNDNGDLNGDVSAGLQLLFTRDVFESGGLQVSWIGDTDLGGSVRVADSLFVNGTASCALYFNIGSGNPELQIINNTFASNASRGLCFENTYTSGGDTGQGFLYADNNILWGNGSYDLYSTEQIELTDNVIGSSSIPPQNIPPSGTRTANPLLDANFRPGTSPASNAINSGTSTPRGGLPIADFNGNSRWLGSAPDRGAFETTVDDGFIQYVKNNNDSGPDSLRQAIINANSNADVTLINFAIPGGCSPAQKITLKTPLPPITASLLLNGFTQPGASPNDLPVGNDANVCIVLDGATNNLADGFTVPSSVPDTMQFLLWGVAFSGFTDAAIKLAGGSAHSVRGVHLGGSTSGRTLASAGYGIYIDSGVHDAQIGGDDAGSRNIIGSALNDGIFVAGPASPRLAAHDNTIDNNYIGLGWNAGAFLNRANSRKGIHVLGYGNEIRANLIGDNGSDGIDFDGASARSNIVEDNDVGTNDDGFGFGNGSMGVRVENGGHNNTIRGNTIAMNFGTGVRIVSGLHNAIRRNNIFQNASFGIDLGTGGIDIINDDGAAAADTYANRGQNYPELKGAFGLDDSGMINGTLTALPGKYKIDVFYQSQCDASQHGEGRHLLLTVDVTVPAPAGSGDMGVGAFSPTFTLHSPRTLATGDQITATATDADGNTSEFSQCFPYYDDRIFADGFD